MEFTFVLILLFVNFGLFVLAFLFLIKEILKANKKSDKNKSSVGKKSYAAALLAMVMMVFISFLLLGY